MSSLGKTRRIQWSEAKPPGSLALRIEEGIVQAVHENPVDVCHYLVDVMLGGELERVSLVIRDPMFRDKLVSLLRERAIGRPLQEVKEWPEP